MHLTTWYSQASCELGSWASCTGQPTGQTSQLNELGSCNLRAGKLQPTSWEAAYPTRELGWPAEMHISCNVGAGKLRYASSSSITGNFAN